MLLFRRDCASGGGRLTSAAIHRRLTCHGRLVRAPAINHRGGSQATFDFKGLGLDLVARRGERGTATKYSFFRVERGRFSLATQPRSREADRRFLGLVKASVDKYKSRERRSEHAR